MGQPSPTLSQHPAPWFSSHCSEESSLSHAVILEQHRHHAIRPYLWSISTSFLLPLAPPVTRIVMLLLFARNGHCHIVLPPLFRDRSRMPLLLLYSCCDHCCIGVVRPRSAGSGGPQSARHGQWQIPAKVRNSAHADCALLCHYQTVAQWLCRKCSSVASASADSGCCDVAIVEALAKSATPCQGQEERSCHLCKHLFCVFTQNWLLQHQQTLACWHDGSLTALEFESRFSCSKQCCSGASPCPGQKQRACCLRFAAASIYSGILG